MKESNITDSILIDYLNGNISEKQREEVSLWLKEDRNRRHFESLKAVWEITAFQLPAIEATEVAWARVMQKVNDRQHSKKTISFPQGRLMAGIAASLALLTGIFLFWKYTHSTKESELIIASHPEKKQLPKEQKKTEVLSLPVAHTMAATQSRPKSIITSEKNIKPPIHALATAHSKEEICNYTNCPLEICIFQSLECNGAITSYSHCSVLQPDASGLLHYKSVNDTTAYCRAPVSEIRIKRINTGETIVLNADTRVTAQEFFDYITGNKKGDVVAGVFDTDCNNYCMDQSIRLDNRLGTPMILQ